MSTGQSDEGRPNLPAQAGSLTLNARSIPPPSSKVMGSETRAGEDADTQSVPPSPTSSNSGRSQTSQSASRGAMFSKASRFSIENLNISQHFHCPLAGMERCLIYVNFSGLNLLLAHDYSLDPVVEDPGRSVPFSYPRTTSPSRGSSVSSPYICPWVHYYIPRLGLLHRQ
jgi:hypothetical protein